MKDDASILSSHQREMLKEHVYRSEGCSITETLVLKHFWNWLTARFPLWLAPNAITLAGLMVTLSTTLSVILHDLNCAGVVSLRGGEGEGGREVEGREGGREGREGGGGG